MVILILIVVALYVLYAYGTARQDVGAKSNKENKWHIWKTLGQFGFGGAWVVTVYMALPAVVAIPAGGEIVMKGFSLYPVWFLFLGWWLSQRLFEGFYSVLKTGKWYGAQTRTIPVEWMSVKMQGWFSSKTGLQIKWNQIRLEGNTAKAADAIRVIIGGGLLYWLI